MVIELVYVQGFEPSATAINNFTFFECRSNKPGGITVVKVDCLTRESYFTNQEISKIRKYNTANQIVWALLLTHPLQTQGTAMF
jgi:hypothetical protein